MKKLLKILTMVAAVLTTAVLFTTCKQFLDDPEDFLSYWAAEVVPTGYDIDIAKPYLISNDGVICVPSNNYLLSDGSVTVMIYLRNPKKFSLVMPSSTSSALDVQKIIHFPGFDADHQPKYSADNDYTLEQTPDKQALKLKYKSSFLKKHEWGTADIGPEITLKSTDGRQFNKKFSLNLKVNTAPSFDYKGVGKTYAGGKWYYVLIFQAKNMEEQATAGHYVHEDIKNLHIVKRDEAEAHYTVSNIDFPNKKIKWKTSDPFLDGATQLTAGDCEGTPPVLPTGDWLIYFKTDVEVSTSSALKTYEAWLSDKAYLLSNKVQGSTCIRKIGDIEVLKKGMTNRSFLFSAPGGRYVMRIPGEGTDKLINRSEEAKVYKLIRNKNVCVDPVYVNEENGYMISKFISNARNCDPLNEDDLKLCMKKLRQFHRLNLKSDSSFDIFSKIQFYEDLCGGSASIYKDYKSTKENVMRLKSYIEGQKKNICLTHIDAVHDNFILHTDLRGRLHVSLIDWEYSAMQDPHVDIAMFCIYALYDKDRTDRLIDIYFGNRCSERTRIKIYCYIAACGLLWSNWCEYKFKFGYEFGEYSIMQYHYAKEYYKYAEKYLD